METTQTSTDPLITVPASLVKAVFDYLGSSHNDKANYPTATLVGLMVTFQQAVGPQFQAIEDAKNSASSDAAS